MRRLQIGLLSLWSMTSYALAADAVPLEPYAEALQQELQRVAPALALPGHEAPYHVRLHVEQGDWVRADGNRGALMYSGGEPMYAMDVEVRVGSPELDNMRFGDFWDDDGVEQYWHGIEATTMSAQHELWWALDEQYKDAVKHLGKRQASRRQHGHDDFPASFDLGEVYKGHAPVQSARVPSRAHVERLAREMSAAYRPHPWVDGGVRVGESVSVHHVIDTAGTLVREGRRTGYVQASMDVTADDGESSRRMLRWAGVELGDAVWEAAMAAEIEEELRRMSAWREIEPAEEAYVGPVLFEESAATELFHSLLLAELEGTPPYEKESTSGYSYYRSDDEKVEPIALKRRVLPDGWEVVDRPMADPSLASSIHYDQEGVPAQDLTLVDDGIVRSHYMTRMPNEYATGSNGHARGDNRGKLRGLPTWTTVRPPKRVSAAKLLKMGIKLANSYELDHIMVVRSVSTRNKDGNRSRLGTPAELVRVYADGREETVRGLTWGQLDRRSLRDMVAASGEHRSFLQDEVHITVSAPHVLLEEVELVPVEPSDRQDAVRVPPSE